MQHFAITQLAIVLISVAHACNLSADSAKPVYSHLNPTAVEQVEVQLTIVKKLSNRWVFEGVVTNHGKEPVFVMTSPIRADGSKGPYISLDRNDPAIMEMGVKLFAVPAYFLYSNATGVQIEKLAPGATHRETFDVSLPLSETMPPYGEKLARRQIDANVIRSIRLSVGVLPDEPGIREMLQRKPFGPFLNGSELLATGEFKGKPTLDLQSVVSSSTLLR